MTSRDTQTAEANLAIGEAARSVGVSVETLRRWEREGKIKSFRTEGGQRRFPESEINRIKSPDAALAEAEVQS